MRVREEEKLVLMQEKFAVESVMLAAIKDWERWERGLEDHFLLPLPFPGWCECRLSDGMLLRWSVRKPLHSWLPWSQLSRV